MSQITPFNLPLIPVFIPSWAMLAIAFFVLVALGLAGSVWMAARRAEVTRHHVLSFVQALLWVIPALVVVGMVGLSTQTQVAKPEAAPEEVSPVASGNPPDLLRSRTTSSETPVWARPPKEKSGEKKGVLARFTKGLLRRIQGDSVSPEFLVFSSDPFVTEAEASKALTPKVQEVVQQQLKERFPIQGDFTVPVALIDQHAVKESVLETFEKDLGIGTERLVRLHLAIQVSPEFEQAVFEDWKGQVATERLTRYGAGVGMATALAGLIAGYLGLNTITQGKYLWRLRLAAAAGLTAAGLLGLLMLV